MNLFEVVKASINAQEAAQAYGIDVNHHGMALCPFHNDRFYTVEGPLPDESKLKRTIYEEISPWLHAKVAQTVEQIIKALKLAAYTDSLPLQCDRIHVANGTCFLDGTFTEEKEYCGNRLLVSYRADAPAPEYWLRFLSELLEPEDIPALQEYLGYCLIPSTKGQKMLMLIGKGGEGKSRIGVVMSAIFGLNIHPEGRKQSFRQSRPGGQAAHGGR